MNNEKSTAEIRNSNIEIRDKSEMRMTETLAQAGGARFQYWDFGHSNLFRI